MKENTNHEIQTINNKEKGDTSQKVMKYVGAGALGLSFLGLADTSYLSVLAKETSTVVCIFGGSCNDVLSSSYASFLGLPLGVWGFFFYILVFLSALLLLLGIRKAFRALQLLAIVGFTCSLYFVYLQLFVIGSICTYCMISAGTSTLLFIFVVMATLKTSSKKSKERGNKPSLSTSSHE